MGLHKIIKIVAWLLGIAGVVSLVLILSKGDDVIKSAAAGGDTGTVDPMYAIAMVILVLVVVTVLVFVLKGIFAGDIKKTLLSVGAFLVIVAISYGLATGTEQQLQDGSMLSAGGSRWVGAGLYAFYILAIVAVGAMVLSGVKKLTSK
ncbi:MAG: hypothetical protein AAFP76_02295 [Bacteroidota bacterium]